MKQVFYDPRQRRRKILRRVTDLSIIGLTAVLVVFAFSVLSRQTLPELLLPTQKRNYKALKESQPELARRLAARPVRPPAQRAAEATAIPWILCSTRTKDCGRPSTRTMSRIIPR